MYCQQLPCIIQKLLQELASPSHVSFTNYTWLTHSLTPFRQQPFTSDEQKGLVNHLRTQLFIIKILCYCMSYHWAWHREQLDDNLAKQLVATISFFLKEHQRFKEAAAALGPIGTQPSSININSNTTSNAYEPHRKATLAAANPHLIFGLAPGRDGNKKPIVPSLMVLLAQPPPPELSAQFVHLKRPAQSDIALALRRAIWNWIKTYPNEYAGLVRSNGRLEGAPGVLFNVAHGLSENCKKRACTWPMMSMLLAVCPDIVLKITVGNCNRSQVTARKAAFIESLRKHLKAVKMADVATACCVDLCKAATFFPKTTTKGPGLCLLALNLVSNLNARLLDPAKPFTNANGVVKIPLMSEALAALCKLDMDTLSTPGEQAQERGDNNNGMANWNVKLQELYPAIASSLRHVFMSAVIESNQFHILMCLHSKMMAGKENGQKTEMVRALLNLWTQDCKLAFFVVPAGGRSAPLPGRFSHELNSRLASGADNIDSDDLEMFTHPIVGTAILKALLDSWVFREEEREVLQLLMAYLDRLKEAVECSKRASNGFYGFASKASAADWHIFGHLLRLAVPLGLCTVDHVFEKFPAVLRLCGLNAKLSSVQLLATLQGLPNGGNGLGGRVAQAQRAKLIMCTIASNSPIINPIWDEALRFWKLLLRLVGHRPFEDGSGDTGLYNPLPALRPLSGEGVLFRPLSFPSLLPSPPYLFVYLLHDRFYAVPDRARNVDR
ncbi:hypothetical protein PTTG_04965 [Puccinia triticina 1-1 BBBD Race 1]|uniref:Uncharacterized protein n=1 Tax=Puccinia triticina (isolate 1-1 / race 1 (BBBD)) TaxID=630390 RepID=A0A180GKB2_PUCT1|nr:hypothetical protein PTTG_04965 [Puccinia triticina 1-1 BBBD Race 1]